MNATDGCWRTVCNVKSLLGDSKDVHIGNLTQQHPAKGSELCLHPHLLPDTLRFCIYNVYVLRILVCNYETWCSTDRDIGSLEAHHRRLRHVLRIHYHPPDVVSMEALWSCSLSRHRLFQLSRTFPDTMILLENAAYWGRIPTYPNHSRQDLRLKITPNLHLRIRVYLYAFPIFAKDRVRWKVVT